MAAQLIVMRSPTRQKSAEQPGQKPDADSEKDKQEEQKAGPSGGSGPRRDPYGPVWFPVGTFTVAGQDPVRIGHYKTVEELLDSARVKKLPGGSNTVFATVENLHGLRAPSLYKQLGALSEELTIIIHEDEPLV